MANKKITDLDALVLMQNTDLFVAYDLPNLATKKISLTGVWNSLKTSVIASDDITWAQVNKTGSDLDDLATKNAVDLQATGPDVLLGRTSSGTGDVETVTCTAFARSILDDEDADEVIETLGLDVTADEVSYALTGWYKLNNTTFNSVLADKYYDGVSFINDCDTWGALETYTAGDIVIPATGTGFLYLCVTGGTSDSSEPTFPTVLGQQVTDSDVVWMCIAKHIIDTNIDLRYHVAYKEGCAVKAKVATSYYYGRLYTATSGELVVKFATPFSGDIDELYFGLDKVQTQYLFRSGSSYNAEPEIKSGADYGFYFVWGGTKGRVVDVLIMNKTDDTVEQPIFGLEVAGSDAYNTNLRPVVPTTFGWSYSTTNSNAVVSMLSEISFTIYRGGGAGNAAYLNVIMVVVLE